MSAAALAAAVRSGETSAREVAAEHLDRADAAQARLNAFTAIDAARTLAAARLVDARVAAGDDPGPLAGVPVAVKDLFDEEGLPTTAGSGFYREMAAGNAAAVARLEAAGAVMLGRTGLHEFAFGFSSENHWWGPVRNPWDPGLSPGGSSGGSAAAVAAGIAPLALGTDTGGSVRVPAALCGITGLKVTHGRVPLDGVFPLAPSLDTVGPLATTVADAALMFQVLADEDPVPPSGAQLRGLRVAVPVPWTSVPLDPVIDAAFRAALDRLADLGCRVDTVDVALDYPGMLTEAFGPEVAEVHRRWFPARRDEYGPDVAERLDGVFAVTPEQHAAAREWRVGVREAFDRTLTSADVLATPATAVRRKAIGVDTVDLAGREVFYRPELSRFSALVNQGGHPALALPLLTGQGGAEPPPSLQLVGPHGGEHRLLAIGLALEDAGVAGYREPSSGRRVEPLRNYRKRP